MYLFILFNDKLKNGTVSKLVSISNIWSKEFIYKGNILIILSQLHQLNLEQNLTNISSFTSLMFLTRRIQPPPPTPHMHSLVLIFSDVCPKLLCICFFLGIDIKKSWSCQFSCWGIVRYTPPLNINNHTLLNCPIFPIVITVSISDSKSSVIRIIGIVALVAETYLAVAQ